jgi:hypothetical protein
MTTVASRCEVACTMGAKEIMQNDAQDVDHRHAGSMRWMPQAEYVRERVPVSKGSGDHRDEVRECDGHGAGGEVAHVPQIAEKAHALLVVGHAPEIVFRLSAGWKDIWMGWQDDVGEDMML